MGTGRIFAVITGTDLGQLHQQKTNKALHWKEAM